jgi:hypothetical protein
VLSADVSGGEIGASDGTSRPRSADAGKSEAVSGSLEMSGDGAWSIAAGLSVFVVGPSFGGTGPSAQVSVFARPSMLSALSVTIIASERPASAGFWHFPGDPVCAPTQT